MLVCIPSKGNNGLEDTLNDHFGSAPYFTIIETDSDRIEVVENRNSKHSHGTCHPLTQLKKYHLDSLLMKAIVMDPVQYKREI